MTIRLKEHKSACRLTTFKRSMVAEHAWQEGHEIEWNNVEILVTAKDMQEWKAKKSLYIRIAPKTYLMNRDEGRELPLLWLRTIRNAKKRPRCEPLLGEAHTSASANPDPLARTPYTPRPLATLPQAVRKLTPTLRQALIRPTIALDTPTN